MGKVFLIVTVGPDYRLLPRFLEYYIKSGIEKFLVILNTKDREAHRILSLHGLSSVYTWTDTFSEDTKQRIEREIINQECSYKDWIVYTDVDEFQYYPEGLIESIYMADNADYDYIEGRLLDRVSCTGELRDLDPENKLETQFPLGGYITAPLLNAWDKKIVAARKNKIVGGGHHIFLDETSLNTLPYNVRISGPYKDIAINHFKWDSHVLNRMKKYLKLKDDSLQAWRKEISSFLEYYSIKSRIDVTDAKFNFSEVAYDLNI